MTLPHEGRVMAEFDEQLKDHLLKYHLRDLQHDAEIVKLTEQNENLWADKERLEDALKNLCTCAQFGPMTLCPACVAVESDQTGQTK